MNQPLLSVENFRVVDNFCPRVDEVRQSFIESGFGTWTPPMGASGHANYRGMNFHGLSSLMLASLHLALGGPAFPNFCFARQTDDTSDPAYIHSDRNDGAKTCIVYLSRESGVSGTAFFRHRRTGWDRMPPVSWLRENGLFDSLWADMRETSSDVWEETDFVRASYNRGLIFDAPLFHQRRQPEGIQSEAEQARIVWVAHFHTAATVENQTR